jgi:hypothetical protein
MQCVTSAAYNDDACSRPFLSARAVIGTEIGVEYFIFVHSTTGDRRGDFGLTVSSFDSAPNDFCTGALMIKPDSGTIFGTTFEATDSGTVGCSSVVISDTNNDNENNNTNNNNNNNTLTAGAMARSPDLWYRVEGTGGMLMASMCGDHTAYDSQIEILEAVNGTCPTMTTLSCVVSNDDACGVASQVEWLTTLGMTYYIRVFGYAQSRGQFQLSVTTP